MAEILANGWQLQITIPNAVTGGAYDLGTDSAPTVSVTVTSKSWTVAGVETTLTRTVYGKAVLRKPYPDQLVKDEVVSGSDITIKVVLNDYVYASETVSNVAVSAGFHTDSGSGGSGLPSGAINEAVTNSSTFAYRKPIATWLNHDLDWVKANSYNVQMAVAHKDFRSGLPVRAVKFIATDTSLNTTSTTVSTMTKLDFPVTGLSAPVFSADLDFSELTQGQMVTIDAIIYPWIGDAFQVSIDADTYPSPNLTVLKVLNDRTGGYGTAYAYVDGVGGGTPSCSADPSTAAENPYSTIALAAAGLQVFINSTYSRNNVSGGIIRLTATTHVHSTYSARAVGDIPLIIEPADVANKSTTIYQDSGANAFDSIPDKLKIYGITLQKTADIGMFDSAATTSANILILDSCAFYKSGGTVGGTFIYRVGRLYLHNCDGEHIGAALPYSSTAKEPVAVGCLGNVGSSRIVIGCKDMYSNWLGSQIYATNRTEPRGAFIGWNFLGNSAAADILNWGESPMVGPRGFAIIGNILEKTTSATNPAISFADNGTTPANTVENFIEMANTVVGSRTNMMYNDASAEGSINRSGVSSYSIHRTWNCKTDIFALSGACTGNWPFCFRIGSCINVTKGADSLYEPTYSSLGDVYDGTIVFDFADDQSFDGGGAGGGDYTPGGETTIPHIPAGQTAYPFDLLGRSVPTDGTALIGALQQQEVGGIAAAMMMAI